MPHPPGDFPELVDRWATWLEHNRGRAPSTVSKYAGHLLALARWCEDPPEDPKQRPSTSDPLQLTPADLEAFAGLVAHARGLSPRARRPMVSAIRGFYAWAEQAGHVRSNPARTLSQPAAGRRLPKAASLRDAERLLMAPGLADLRGYRDTAIIALLAGASPRVSGLCGLNESSLRWSQDEGQPVRLSLLLSEKGKRERLVPVPDEAAVLVGAYLSHPDLEAIDRALPSGDAVVFVNLRAPTIPAQDHHGERRRLSPRGVQRMLERYAAACGVARELAHPHALRHLYGTELAESDVDLIERQSLLGHERADTTGIYTRLAQRRLRDLVDKANPLAKMRGPLIETTRALRGTLRAPSKRPLPGPANARKT